MEALHQPGDIIAQRYCITDTLGQGGVGITYAAEELKSGEQVALKVLSLRQMGDWKVLELFEREAKILAQLNHPAIPRYLDYFQVDTAEDRAFYIVQQLAEGKSLAELAKIGWRTNESGVRRIATQILEILVYLHSLKPPVVHRDIKPQNLIWSHNAKIFLVDFGAVQDTYRSTFAKGSTIIGTYGYMAPEQFLGKAVPVTDLYGLGATVLFLLTHRSPADLPQERLKISFRSRIQVSERFADWLEKMLEPDVEERFSSAKEALEVLQGRRIVPKLKLRRSVRRKALVGAAVATVGAAVATVGAFTVFNSFKWSILLALGFPASGICNAANNGNIDVARNYLKQGGDINATDADSNIPVLLCLLSVKNGKKEIVKLVIPQLSDANVRDESGTTPLHLTDSVEIAQLLIAKGADVNARDNYGNTPLHSTDSVEVARMLIAKGANVNARDESGTTPLQSTHSVEVAQVLIAKGADVNVRNRFDGTTLLHSTDSVEVAQSLIAKGADVNARGNYGNTPLHSTRSVEVAQLLIAKRANINAKNRDGNTPLHSTYSGEVAQLLIAKGADINARNSGGDTPLHTTRSGEVAQLLIAKGADVNARSKGGNTPLHSTDSGEVAQLLIAKGADVNARSKGGNTPLHSTDSVEVAQLLIAKGADVNARNSGGSSPLHTTDSGEVAQLLIAKGADVNARNSGGSSPLHTTYSRRGMVLPSRGKVWLLLSNRADVNARDNYGQTPLHLTKSRQVAQLLLSHRADVNAKDNYGSTPLHRIVACDIPRTLLVKKFAELLIAKGADVNTKDNYGNTPLHWLANTGRWDVAELLIAKGAKINATNSQGYTPLHITAIAFREDWSALLPIENRQFALEFLSRGRLSNSKDMAQLLLVKGAQINARDNEGKTPLSWALKTDDKNLINLLKSHGGIE